MKTYNGLELLEIMPDGWRIDTTAGSPLTGYSFVTDGKSILRGGKRALLAVRPRQHMLDLPVTRAELTTPVGRDERKQEDPSCPRVVNELARKRFENKLLADIRIDLMVCEIEGLSQIEYLAELRELINGIGRDSSLTHNTGINASHEVASR